MFNVLPIHAFSGLYVYNVSYNINALDTKYHIFLFYQVVV